MNRPTWNDTFFDITMIMAKRGTCPRLQTAAVIVSSDHRILSTGYNGAPSGSPHCLEVGCLMEDNHCIQAVHAELNAILYAAKRGIPINGEAMYSLHSPCARCAIAIIQAGIQRIIYKYFYGSGIGLTVLKSANIEVIHYEST